MFYFVFTPWAPTKVDMCTLQTFIIIIIKIWVFFIEHRESASL